MKQQAQARESHEAIEKLRATLAATVERADELRALGGSRVTHRDLHGVVAVRVEGELGEVSLQQPRCRAAEPHARRRALCQHALHDAAAVLRSVSTFGVMRPLPKL